MPLRVAAMNIKNNTVCISMTCVFACVEFTAIEKFNKNEKNEVST